MLKTKKLYRLMAGLLAALMICVSVPAVAFAEGDDTGWYTVKYQSEDGTTIAGDTTVSVDLTEQLYETKVSDYFSKTVHKDIEGYQLKSVTIDGKLDDGILLGTGDHEVIVTYAKNEEPAPEYIAYEIVDADTEEYLTTWQVLEGEMLSTYSGAEPQKDGYTFEYVTFYNYDKPVDLENTRAQKNGDSTEWTLYAHFTKNEEPVPEYITYKIVDSDTEEYLTTWQVLEGEMLSTYSGAEPQKDGYTFEYVTFYNYDKPVDLENTRAQKNGDSTEWTLYAHFTKNEEPVPEYITYKIVDADTEEHLTTWQVLEGEALSTYSGAEPQKDGYTFEYVTFYNYDKPVDLENTRAQKNGESTEWTLYAHFTKNAQPVESVNIRFEFVDSNGEKLYSAVNVGTTWSEGETAPALKSFVEDEIKAVEANGYKFDYMTWVYSDGSESSALQEPVVVPDYDGTTIRVYFSRIDTPEDVNFRVEFVDKDGNTLRETVNVATTYSDFDSSQKLSELLADDIAGVEAEGYRHIAFTLVYADGSESSSLIDPVVVPDYDGMTIKAYFAKAEDTEDVNIRFEFVNMNGETLREAVNFATVYTDSEIGPKLSGVVSNEITAVEADGYKFVMFTMVYEDGSESSALADPVVVPDYDGKTIKVYFVDADEYEDVNIRFEFVDMTGETILPAVNYATTYTDSAIGPKVADVIADETAKLAKSSYVFDHFAWVYADGTETELNDPVVVPDYHNTTIKVYYAQPAHYRFTFVNDKTGEAITVDTLDVKINDIKTNVDKYVLDLVAGERRTLEEAGWIYVGIKNAYNPDEYAQNDSLVVPGGPYEYLVCFTKADTTPEEPSNPGDSDSGNTGSGSSDSGSSGSSSSGSSDDASKSSTPADNSAKILPKTGYGEGTVSVVGITAVVLAAAAGAAAYLFTVRRRLH